jgi:hypothetical protein
MRVEIDLFNGDDEGYRKLLEAIKTGGPDRPTKGIDDPAPVRAFASGTPNTRRLLPGMTGSITLTIGGFGESYVLPSSAVYTRGGASYLLLVENGKTREVSVRVQLNDGNTTRVAILTKRADAKNNTREVLMDLTGAEAIVAARQAEFGSGAVINPAFADW